MISTMANSPKIEISFAFEADLAEVRSFYSSVGYDGGVSPQDRVLVGRQDDTIVAAVKLSPEDKTLVLRGMYVAESIRGHGFGSALLARISAEIGVSCCWCIPYSHLERFYSSIGFRIVESGKVPEFLLARKQQYLAAGRDVIIMRRPTAGSM